MRLFIIGAFTGWILALDPAPAGAQTITPITHLHTLLDGVNYLPTNTTTLFTVEGVVTTHTNLTTSGNALFYIQDATAGIAVFVSGGADLRPRAGDRVRVTGPLGHFNGLLELNLRAATATHTVEILASDEPLPEPAPLEFGWQSDPALMEPREGSYVVVSNVFLDLTSPVFRASGTDNVNMTNARGEVFTLRVDERTDIGGQAKPTGLVTVRGVLSQFDANNPRSAGYQLIPSRWADIVSVARAPIVRFTNVLQLARAGDAPTNGFAEQVLLPGDRITIQVEVNDPEGRPLHLSAPMNDLPDSASWVIPQADGNDLSAIFTYTAGAEEAGRLLIVRLDAANDAVTNRVSWRIYVPTPAEQRVTVTEFLANPSSNPTAVHFNPLNREEASSAPSSEDEYIELANLTEVPLDLLDWTIADTVQIRHRFNESFPLASSNAVVVYGGPLNGLPPRFDSMMIPASEGASGLGLNNSGGDTIWVRNADSNLVVRIVYQSLSSDSSLTRTSDLNSAFAAHDNISTNRVSPGRQYDGRPFSEPSVVEGVAENITLAITREAGAFVIRWAAVSGQTFTVLAGENVAGPYEIVANGLEPVGNSAEYRASAADVDRRFYRVRSP